MTNKCIRPKRSTKIILNLIIYHFNFHHLDLNNTNKCHPLIVHILTKKIVHILTKKKKIVHILTKKIEKS